MTARPSQILVVVGSRPEAIKLAPVVRALQLHPEAFDPIVCSTGQQRDMIPPALQEFDLQPDLALDVMEPDQTLARLTARLSQRLDRTIEMLAPDWIVVQGDTTSAMVGALVGFYRRVPVAHVEAGMRTGNVSSPFPEEVNRRIITQCATLHFAATTRCQANLLREGLPAARVVVTGNTVVDALLMMRERIRRTPSRLPENVRRAIDGRRVVLVTTHRRESFDGGLSRICQAVRQIVDEVTDITVVLPVHPNPTVTDIVGRTLGHRERVLLIEPLAYQPFLELMDRSHLIMTDSGGLQEEAPSFGKPLLVLRHHTERPEGLEAGVARLVGTNQDVIVAAALELLGNDEAYRRMANSPNPYGDGAAAQRIAAYLKSHHHATWNEPHEDSGEDPAIELGRRRDPVGSLAFQKTD